MSMIEHSRNDAPEIPELLPGYRTNLPPLDLDSEDPRIIPKCGRRPSPIKAGAVIGSPETIYYVVPN